MHVCIRLIVRIFIHLCVCVCVCNVTASISVSPAVHPDMFGDVLIHANAVYVLTEEPDWLGPPLQMKLDGLQTL